MPLIEAGTPRFVKVEDGEASLRLAPTISFESLPVSFCPPIVRDLDVAWISSRSRLLATQVSTVVSTALAQADVVRPTVSEGCEPSFKMSRLYSRNPEDEHR